MKAVLLLAGKNSRFFPLETMGHKSMSKIYGRYLIEYLFDDLVEVGIKDVVLVTGKFEDMIKEKIGDGSQYNLKISYAKQEEPKGQGDAILSASELINDDFIIPNPNHFFQADIFKNLLDKFSQETVDCIIPGVEVDNPWDYGIMELDGKKIKGMIEKPPKGQEPSNYKATSAYVFKKDFLECLENVPETDDSYEVAIDKYSKDKNVQMFEIPRDRYVSTLKYPWHLLEIKDHIGKRIKGYVHPTAQIADNAIVENSVYIDEGAKVFEGAVIKGNTYIGKNAIVGNMSLVRDSDLGEGVQVGVFSDITRSIIMRGSKSHGGGFIGDTIVGEESRIAAGVITANKRADRSDIICEVKNKKVRSKTNSLGLVAGKKSKLGIGAKSMPGKFIGENSIIWPAAIISKNLDHNSELIFKQDQEIKSHD